MNPIYKFTLSVNGGTEQAASPIYREDLSKDFELQTNEQFYRAKLSGTLVFVGTDYDYITKQNFDAKFGIKIYISYNAGQTWALYWAGEFWKTNCKFDDDNNNVTLTPDVIDQYTAVLAGMDKEFNLLELAPAIEPIKLQKRPCLQIYVAGKTSIGQIMFGNCTYWETECEQFNPYSHYFDTISNQYPVLLEFGNTGQSPATSIQLYSPNAVVENITINYGEYTLQITEVAQPGGGVLYDIIVTRNSDGAQWRDADAPEYGSATLEAVAGTGADYDYVDFSTLASISVVGRMIYDLDTAGGYDINTNDPVFNNRNYKYCRPVMAPIDELIVLTARESQTPTPYGRNNNGNYYNVPDDTGHYVPIAQNSWGAYSIWLDLGVFVSQMGEYDTTLSEENTLNHAYPLWSIISVLLAQIAPNISHAGTATYSQFLYGTNPITTIAQRLFITPKSNVITLGYDQPAQKAPITLKQVMDMLRDCFRCFWFIDDQNRFRIEHIKYFRNGGTYQNQQPEIGRDLTQEIVTRNGKPWAFGTSQYEFDKPEMAARYQFGWMDDVTQLFKGFPIDILSQYVNPDNIEEINVSRFTTDIDFVLLNPDSVSKEGFMLLSAYAISGVYHLRMLNVTYDGITHKLQNGWVSFNYLQRYYAYDMPAKYYRINGEDKTALGIKKLKRQTLKMPAYTDPNTLQLIKTNIGNGTIQKMSLNLSSRNANATLIYDTE